MKKTIFLITALILALNLNILVNTATASSPYYIKVNTATNCVTVYSAEGTPVKAMICSTGKASEGNATPAGTFSTSQKIRWHTLFGSEYGQYCTRITGHILFHSVPYFSQNENDLNTANYNMLGEQDSLGCVRLTVADAKWIFDNCPIGTSVTIFSGTEADDPLERPSAIKLGENAPYPTWDPTDPSENNPYNALTPTIKPEKYVRSIYQNNYQTKEELTAYLKTGVAAYDTAGNKIDFDIETEADPAETGVYKVTYKATDALGRRAEVDTLFIVLPARLVSNATLK